MSTPVFPFYPPSGGSSSGAGGAVQGPPGAQGPAPSLTIGNVTALAPGSSPLVVLRPNPAGGYFLDFGIATGAADALTQSQADARYAQLLPANGTYRIITTINGTFLEVWNPDQLKWHPFVVRGGAGSEQMTVQPGEA